MIVRIPLRFALTMVLGLCPAYAQSDSARFWKPVKDEVYLQEIPRQIASESPVHSVAAYDGHVYVATDAGVHVLADTRIESAGGPTERIAKLAALNGRLWALAAHRVHHFDGERWRILEGLPDELDLYDVTLHLGEVMLSTSGGLYAVPALAVDGRTFHAELDVPARGGMPRAIASFGETIYASDERGLAVLDGQRWDRVNVADWGKLPAAPVRDLLAHGSLLYIATGDGLGVVQGMTLSRLRGEDGLPYEGLTCLAPGFDGDIWIGTTRGAIRYTDGAFHYFAGKRYLRDDHVNGIAIADRTVYIATNSGLGIIEYEPYTLLKKAAYYERWLEEWGQKRLGFTYKLEWDTPTGTWMREVSDNDAGWSTHYLAAKCFEYAVTGNEAAREEAVYFFDSLKWCEEITPIDGFPARSIWGVGETSHRTSGGSGGYAAEWNPTPDGKWEWKGDTSSDETDAHYYATAIFYELAARGEEKDRALEHLTRITNHIIDNGWVLRDLDGLPTVWARWDPEYLQGPRGFYARGLNGVEILSYVKTAETLTKNPKFTEAYSELLGMNYHREVLRQKLVFPPDDVFHSDDRLAWYVYYNILRYETDPQLRAIYRRSFDRSYEIERIEHNPWFNIMYGALTGADCDEEAAVRHLRDWPLDMVDYSYQNSHRADLHTPAGYSDHANVTRVFSPRETGPMRWSDSPSFDGGSGGRNVVDPSGWLDAYWMGRYYGLIEAPETDDPVLTTVENREGVQNGAVPYDGPPRPF